MADLKLLVSRSTDPGPINAIINHPEVFKWVATCGQTPDLDTSTIIADPKNYLLMTEDRKGGFIFVELEPAIYEIHTNFLPEARGRFAKQALIDAMWWMFTRTLCMEILTKVPANNRAAMVIAKQVGARLDFIREKAFQTVDGEWVDVFYYALRYPDWVNENGIALQMRGHWFHETLERGLAVIGQSEPLHPEDPAHDRHVGAATEMILHGQVDKGVILYNRWGRFAGYAPISLISREPVVVDIVTAKLLVRGDGFEVMPCQPERQ